MSIIRRIILATSILQRYGYFIHAKNIVPTPQSLIPGLIFHGEIPFQSDISSTSRPTSGSNEIISKEEIDFEPIELPSSLKSLQVHARIIDGISEVTMVQHFFTPEFFQDDFVLREATYQVPLDESAAVTKFRAEIDDRIVEAVVKEKNDAREDFEEALQDGKSAFLAEQSRADIFRISIGNVPKGKLVKVTLVYVASLESIDGDTIRFFFPNDLAEIYDPIGNSEAPILDGQDFMENGLSINVEVSMAADILGIKSLTHEIEVNFDGDNSGNALIKVTDPDIQKQDLAVLITTTTSFEPLVYIESSPDYGSTAIMLSIVPEISQEILDIQTKSEYIFIIDRSGSMSGENMEKTRKAMFLVLDQIPDGSIFNIIGFGSTFDVLFSEGSQPISVESSQLLAKEYVTQMQADFGGTELLDPLRYALGGIDMPVLSTYDRIAFVLTDGAVSNTRDTIEYVRNFSSNGRVFALGIGDHVSSLLVRGIARAGKGTSEFVDGDSLDAIKDTVERQMLIASHPALSNVMIDWGYIDEMPGSQAPYLAPNLINGKRFLIFYIVEGEENVPDKIQVTSDVVNTQNTIQYEIVSELFFHTSKEASDDVENNLIHKMACRSLIRDLEEGESKLHLKGISSQENIEREIARLGIKYEIASSQTSFIAVDNEGWNEKKRSQNDLFLDEDTMLTKRGSVAGRASSCSTVQLYVNLIFVFFLTLFFLPL